MQKRYHNLKLVLLGSIIVALTLCAMGCKEETATGASGGSGEMAARVGGIDIPLSKVDRVIEQGLQGQSDKKLSDLSPVELAAARLQALDTLITEESLYQRSRQENVQISDEDVRNQIQSAIQQDGLSADDFQKKLKAAGMTESEFQEEQRRKMAIAKLQDKMSIVKPPTDREISEYFNRNQEQFTLGKGIYLSEIVVDAADNKAKNDAIGEEQAKQKIDQIYTQLKNGADFATVARVQSEDVSSYKGGDLGFLDEAHLQQVGFPAQLVQAFFAMKEGDITPPVQGSKGRWYIFKLTAKRTQEEKLSLDSPDVKAKISQVLIAQRKEILNSALVSAALNQTRIENFLAQRMLQNPDNFGSLRPTSLPSVAKSDAKTETKSDAKPDAKSDAKPDAKASEDVNKDAKDSGKDAKPAGK